MTKAGRQAAIDTYGFATVLSVEDMLTDQRAWGSQTTWPDFVASRREWANDLFDSLMSKRV
jgi:hypothetical protein